MDLHVDPEANEGRGRVVRISAPPAGTTTNDGNLCVKGRFAYDFIEHGDRLTTPLIRGADGERSAVSVTALGATPRVVGQPLVAGGGPRRC